MYVCVCVFVCILRLLMLVVCIFCVVCCVLYFVCCVLCVVCMYMNTLLPPALLLLLPLELGLQLVLEEDEEEEEEEDDEDLLRLFSCMLSSIAICQYAASSCRPMSRVMS